MIGSVGTPAAQNAATNNYDYGTGNGSPAFDLLVLVVKLVIRLLETGQIGNPGGQTGNGNAADSGAVDSGLGGSGQTGNGDTQDLAGLVEEITGLLGQLLNRVSNGVGGGQAGGGQAGGGQAGGGPAGGGGNDGIPPDDDQTATTLAIGEEDGGNAPGDDQPVTTLAIGEEDGGGAPDDDLTVTTLAIGEEDGGTTQPGPDVPTPIAATPLQDGIAPIDDASGQTTGFRDNVGSAINVNFDESGNITGLTTTDRQGGAPGDNGFSTVRTNIDIAGGPISATSSIAIGDPPVEPEPQGEVGQFVGNTLRPALDGDGNLIGFRDATIDEEGFGRELTFTTDANGDIDGYRVTDYATFSFIAGVEPSLGVTGFTDFDLAGNVLARALV